MSIFKDIGKWIHGWRLDKVFQTHPNADISVKEAAAKTVAFLYKVTDFINSPLLGVLDVFLPGNWQAVIQQAKTVILEIQVDLMQIATIPDIAILLKDYQFSPDSKKDKLYHDIVTGAALIFSDGKLSISDAAIAIKIVLDYIQL